MSMFVSYCQYQVYTGEGGDGLGIYTVGDSLLHVGGPAECTGFTGVHTGEIDIRVVVSATEPPLHHDDWDAASETTLWAGDGTVTVLGLMAGPRDELTDIPLAGAGLMRVRIYARNRIHESVRTEEDPPEQHEIRIWPVSEETGLRTLFDDGSRGPWPQKPAEAAVWAISRLSPAAPEEPRVTVVRGCDRSWTPPPVIYAGDVEMRLRPVGDAYSFSWHATGSGDPGTVLPDGEPGIVRFDVRNGQLNLFHENVPASQAVLLGLIWDHLRELPAGRSPAWEQPMRAAAEAAARRAAVERRRRTDREAKAWGGAPPSDRLRGLRARAKQLAALNRALLDAVASLSSPQQRSVAHWAARRAMESAALDRVSWIADALTAAEAGGRPFPDQAEAFRRLLEDPAVPQTLLPGPSSRILHQAVAFPALLALDEEDDLAAAVEALYIAAQSHGSQFPAFLAEAFDHLPRG